MNAGDLRHRVRFERATRVVNAAGETETAWVLHAERWANVQPLKSWQVERARQVQTNTTHVVRVRYDPTIAADQRVVWGAVVLNITGVVNVDGRNVELEIACEQEGVPAA